MGLPPPNVTVPVLELLLVVGLLAAPFLSSSSLPFVTGGGLGPVEAAILLTACCLASFCCRRERLAERELFPVPTFTAVRWLAGIPPACEELLSILGVILARKASASASRALSSSIASTFLVVLLLLSG